MGGAFVGVADDASAVFWNAAGIARIDPDKSELSLNHATWPAELSFDQIGYVFHLKRIPGAFGVHARALSMDPMVETTAFQPDPEIGTGAHLRRRHDDARASPTRGPFTDKFSAGVTANLVHEGLADLSQQTFAFDIGTLYDVGTLGMKIGMAISNIGSQISFIDREARIPAIFRVGTSAMLLQSADQQAARLVRVLASARQLRAVERRRRVRVPEVRVPARRLQHQLRRRGHSRRARASASRSRSPGRPISTTPTPT